MKDKPKVYSLFDRPEKKPSPKGEELQNTYEERVDDKGCKHLVITGQTNVREEIQKYKDDCDTKLILAKAVVDPTILNQRQGFYADTTEMPKTLAEAQNMIIGLRRQFEQLPVEMRKKFDFSAERFIAEYGTKEWADKIGINQEEAQAINQTIKEIEPTKAEGEITNES